MAAALTGVGAGISALGTLGSASAARQAGQAQQAQFNFKAAQEEQQATQAIAASQRQMFDTNRKTALTQSTLQARAAADGGSATDATPLNLSQDIAGRGEYLALGDLFAGQDRAAGLRQQAYADRYSGAAARAGANAQANATILGGVGSLASRFATLGGSSGGLFG
ncbi:hypothetical protein [uncultured Variovorax sp.]|uniref:hypothetical protein n=1 Tax=uncultured Variovorax sp. TaxID=114708 RepID=UPI0026280A6E|nr:hypothetical protein [uncultured Variovorax sp.]